MSRSKAINYIKELDHVVPSDLKIWLNYVGMKKKIFGKRQIHLDQTKYGGLKIINGLKIIFGEFHHPMDQYICQKERRKYEIQ